MDNVTVGGKGEARQGSSAHFLHERVDDVRGHERVGVAVTHEKMGPRGVFGRGRLSLHRLSLIHI